MWNMLNNGVCPPEPSAPLSFVKISSGTYANMAIDNLGRMYAWGSSSYQYQGQTPVPVPSTPNFTRHPATFRASPYYEAMVYPYQIGYPKSDWVDCQTYEYIHMALDSNGYIYAVGDDAGGGSVFGRGGWAVGSKYNEVSDVFVPGGEQAIVMTLVNNQQWTSFVLGAYHVIAQKADKSLWIWGKNLSNATYGTLSYADNYVSLVPIQMSWVPGPVKYYDAGYSVSAVVTESNEIYAWGAWANVAIGLKQVPTLIPFTVPGGETIVDLKCNYSGIIILLSNGDVYGIGWRIGFVAPPADAMVFTKAPGEHNFVKIWAAQETGAAALDSNGVLWGWGNQAYLIVQGGVDDINSTNPAFTGGPDPNVHRWINFAAGQWSHLAINDEGRLFSWGTPIYGLLGIGLFESESEEQYAAIECGPFATLENDINAYESYESIGGTGVSQIRITSPEQLSEHDPCGHWHRRTNFEDGSVANVPCNCWNFALDISGTNVLFVSLGIFVPHQWEFFRYDLSKRIWNGPFYEVTNFQSAQYVAGAATSGKWDVVVGYGGDSSGDKFSPTFTNMRARFVSVDHEEIRINSVNFLDAIPQDFEGQIINDDANDLCLILMRVSSGSYLLRYSVDRGRTFSLAHTFTEVGGISKAKIVKGHEIYYVGVFSGGGNLIRLFTSTDGVSWAEKAIIPLASGNNDFDIHADAASVYITTRDAHFYYSHDRGDSFANKLIAAPTSYMAAAEGSRALLLFFNEGLQRTPNYVTMEDILEIVPEEEYEITYFTVLACSGDNVVYMRANLFVESRIVLPVSQNMGLTWEIVPSPLDYFVDQFEALAGPDDPRWKFSEQPEKFRLDPNYV